MREPDACAYCGAPDECDCEDRIHCPNAGTASHQQCGICEKHGKPRFICGCVLITRQTPPPAE